MSGQLRRIACGFGNGFGRCEHCGQAFFYSWVLGDHFPLKCVYCGERGVTLVKLSDLTPDDKITMHNRIQEIKRRQAGEE